MSTTEQALFIATCFLLFCSGFIYKPYVEESLLREYEAEIEWQNKRYDHLENYFNGRK